MATAVSPPRPEIHPAMPAIAGVKLATAAAGIKYANRTDVLLALLDPGTTVAGVFTRSKCPSAPVEWCRANLKGAKPRALVVNSGNANAFTGKTGRQACQFTAKIAARAIGCKPADIFLASTGVIGEPLNAKAFDGVMEGMVAAARPEPWLDAAKAIMTTDTFPKVATATAKLGKATVTINGIAKGAGMIAPDMATMLSFVFTDAPISARALQALLARRRHRHLQRRDHRRRHLDLRHAAGVRDRRRGGARRAAHRRRARSAAEGLPHGVQPRAGQPRRAGRARRRRRAQAGRDHGRGRGVEAERARRIAMSIANSPLVKTAIAGEDANWGRVVMAVGKAGEPADRDRLSIWFNGIRVAHKGARDPAYDEAAVSQAMKSPTISLKVALGLGRGADRVLTCDLTKEYVAINGDYRS